MVLALKNSVLAKKAGMSYTMFKKDLGATAVKKCFVVSQGPDPSCCLEFQGLHQGP